MNQEQQRVVHIVDDDEGMRNSLQALLQSHYIPSVAYRDAEEFVEHAIWNVPGCLLLDLRMPGMGGERLLERLAADGDPPPTIILTGHGDIENAVRTVRMGAVEYLQKPCSDETLVRAVERAIAADADRLAKRSEMDDLRERLATLTPRERVILDEMTTGRTSQQIAEQLGLQPKSVQVYRSRVLQKMHFATTVEMVRHLLLADPGTWGRTRTA